MSKMTTFSIVALLAIVIALSFGAGFFVGGTDRTQVATQGPDKIGEVWDIILREYVEPDKLNTDNLTDSAINAIITSLNDPYTTYLTVQDYQFGLSSLGGEFDGIGAQVGIREGKLTVIAPIADSPAERAGIKAGDNILAINGESTDNMTVTAAVLKIRGTRGTPVKLLILHPGETTPVEMEIVRASIKLTSVNSRMMGDYAYIQLTQFTNFTDDELIPVLQGLSSNTKGIVLDLRNNPGGILDEVVDIASHFLPVDSDVVEVRSNQQKMTYIKAKKTDTTTDLPIVILVNEGSASGSEVLTGALQDYGRAAVAGTKTYGKGSVNVLHRLSDGSGLYITTARWLTPKGRLIEGKGLDPDYPLTLEGDEEVQWAIDFLSGKK